MLISKKPRVAIEQIKLFANSLNNLGTGSIVLGFLRPILAGPEAESFGLSSMFFGILIGIMLYLAANRVMTQLPDED